MLSENEKALLKAVAYHLVPHRMEKFCLPAMSYAMFADGDCFAEEGFTINAAGNGIDELPSNKAFSVASVTKVFTAVMIYRLVECGELDLTDSVATILAPHGFSHLPTEITTAHLISHHAGLTHDVIPSDFWNLTESFPTIEEVKQRLQGNNITKVSPNTEADYYSNVGYILLAQIIEHVTEKSFHDNLAVMLDALDITEGIYGDGLCPPKLQMVGYSKLSFGERVPLPYKNNNAYLGACGLWATPHAICEFVDKVFYQERYLSKQTLDKMLPQDNQNKLGRFQSLHTAGSFNFIRHSGGYPGFQSMMITVPDLRLTLFATMNCQNILSHTNALCKGMLEILSYARGKSLRFNVESKNTGIFDDSERDRLLLPFEEEHYLMLFSDYVQRALIQHVYRDQSGQHRIMESFGDKGDFEPVDLSNLPSSFITNGTTATRSSLVPSAL